MSFQECSSYTFFNESLATAFVAFIRSFTLKLFENKETTMSFFFNSFVECSNYTFVNESNRAMTYADKSLGNLSDSKLSGWYRFSGGAGTQMAEACPKMYSCSTNSSGWLNGTHPTVAEGIVQRKVCFLQSVSQFFNDCCNHSKNINVRNCGAFYVYRLVPPDFYSRYCGNGLPYTPGKNEFSMSSLVLTRMIYTSEMRKSLLTSYPWRGHVRSSMTYCWIVDSFQKK